VSSAPHRAQRSIHITDVFSSFRKVAIDVQGAGIINRVSRSADYCETFSPCTPPGNVTPGATVGALITMGRFGVGLETQLNGQFTGSRGSRFYDDEVSYRDTSWSILFRYQPQPRGSVAVTLVGGPTAVYGRLRGTSLQKGGGAPFMGFYDISTDTDGFGFTVGSDVSVAMGSRLSVIVPVRFSLTSRELWGDVASHTSLHIGAGLSWSLRRSIILK
jgi:hypothetical protein